MRALTITLAALLGTGLLACQDQGERQAAREGRTTEQERGQTAQPQAQEQARLGETEQQEQAQQGTPGTVQGTVESVDQVEGKLSLKNVRQQAGQTGEGPDSLELLGTPGQIQSYRVGEVATVRYAKYGDNYWLMNEPAQPQGGEQAVLDATIEGRVDQVDKNKGTLTLAGDTEPSEFRAHPQDLEQLTAGQFVSISYHQVQGKNWVEEVSQGRGGTEGQQEQKPQEQPGSGSAY